MPDTPEPAEERRLERIRLLLEKDRAAEQETVGVSALVGGTFEACVDGLDTAVRKATVLAVDAGMILLRYADQEQSRYWVPLVNVRWLKVIP